MTAFRAQADSYLTTKVLTATPAELRLMLIDGAIKFATQGREGLASKNYEAMFNGYTRCRSILVELSTTMRRDIGDPTLVDRMQALYAFMMMRLLESSTGRDLAPADEVIQLLGFERETWVMLMDRLAAEQGATAAAPAAVPPATPSSPVTSAYGQTSHGSFMAHG